MSMRAMLWAWDTAPVDDAIEAFILLALADEANDDGTDSCPYKDKLIERSRKSERTVQEKLRNLYQRRLIDFGDQAVAMRRYGKKPGHAPRAWNLNLSASWDNRPEPRTEEEMKLYARFMATGKVPVDEEGGVQILPPIADQGKQDDGGVQKLPPTEGSQGGVQKLPPTADQGKRTYRRDGGVQPTAPFPIGSKPREIKTSRFGAGSGTSATGVLPGRAAQTGEKISFLIEDQEEALAITDPADKEFFPTDFTTPEQTLFDECLLLGEEKPGWTPRTLRKVIGTPLIRKISAQNPDLVRKTFRIAAQDPDTTSPRRLLHMEKCPHWERAALELDKRDAASPAAGGSAGEARDRAARAGAYDGPVRERPAGEPPAPAQRSPEVAALFAQSGFRFGGEEAAS